MAACGALALDAAREYGARGASGLSVDLSAAEDGDGGGSHATEDAEEKVHDRGRREGWSEGIASRPSGAMDEPGGSLPTPRMAVTFTVERPDGLSAASFTNNAAAGLKGYAVVRYALPIFEQPHEFATNDGEEAERQRQQRRMDEGGGFAPLFGHLPPCRRRRRWHL